MATEFTLYLREGERLEGEYLDGWRNFYPLSRSARLAARRQKIKLPTGHLILDGDLLYQSASGGGYDNTHVVVVADYSRKIRGKSCLCE